MRARRDYRIAKGDKIKTVVFPVFGNNEVKIIFTHCLHKAVKRFKHTRNIEPSSGADALTAHINGEGISYIFMLYEKANTGTMAHEAYHAVRNLLKIHDVEMEQDEEVVAYHLGYLVNEIVELALR